MRLYQQTIANEIALSGTGLHTGMRSEITFLPAPEEHGIRFQRTDLPQRPYFEADAFAVSEVIRGTTLQNQKARLHTVEHVLAAIAGLQVDNLLVRVDGPEVPIMDGSALRFVQALLEAGLRSQNAPVDYYEISDPMLYEDKKSGGWISATPYDGYQLTVRVAYDSEVLGWQEALLDNLQDFETQIAPSRTFCFFHELEFLHRQGLIQGGDLSNAVVIVDREIDPTEMHYLARLLHKDAMKSYRTGILNAEPLRYPNEAARHKLLDVLGDLMLIGKPLKGKITAYKPGHASNVTFARRLKQLIREKAMISKV